MPDDPFAEALVYEDALPLGWEVVERVPAGQRIATLNASNEALLRVREGLEEPTRGVDENQDLSQEFQRLESKLNLILELMAEWLRRQGDLPSPLPVRFNAWGIAWEAEDLPVPDALLRMQLYICPTVPKPLVLYARVLASGDRGVRNTCGGDVPGPFARDGGRSRAPGLPAPPPRGGAVARSIARWRRAGLKTSDRFRDCRFIAAGLAHPRQKTYHTGRCSPGSSACRGHARCPARSSRDPELYERAGRDCP
jgi:hypothetical protein